MSFQINKPQAGYYKRRLVKGGPWVGVHIWYGPPTCPHTGQLLDRSWRWQALVNGEDADEYEAWISGCANPITKEEYEYLLAHSDWAKNYAPDLAPDKKIDLNKINPIF